MPKGDYRPDYRVTTILRRTASAVVTLFMFRRDKMNGFCPDYRSHPPRCSHPVVTLKPAENRRFFTLTTILSSILKKKEEREKAAPVKVTRANGGQVVTLSVVRP